MTEERAHDPAAPPESEGIPETADDASPRPAQDVDPQRMAMPGDVPVSLDEYGTTRYEAARREPLSGKLNRERADEPEAAAGGGRIVEPDEGVREDVDKDMIGRDAGSPPGDLSAEEAAVNPVDEFVSPIEETGPVGEDIGPADEATLPAGESAEAVGTEPADESAEAATGTSETAVNEEPPA